MSNKEKPPSDFNDLHVLHGLDEVKKQLLAAAENHGPNGFDQTEENKDDFSDFDLPVSPVDKPVVHAFDGRVPFGANAIIASSLAGFDPKPMEWALEGWAPLGSVTGLGGPPGAGKSLLGQQLCTHVSTGSAFLGIDVEQAPALYITCEDDLAEVHRRQVKINAGIGIGMEDLDSLHLESRVGLDSTIVRVDNGIFTRLPGFFELNEKISSVKARLVVLDLVPDFWNGNEIVRQHVNGYVKQNLAYFAKKNNCALVVLYHPSKAGMASGTGESGSTAWEGSFRTRIYLGGEDNGVRVLAKKKANYSASDEKYLRWVDGYLEHEETYVAPLRPQLGKVQRQILDILEKEYQKAKKNLSGSERTARVEHVAWWRLCDQAGVKRKSFDAARDGLMDKRVIFRDGPFVYIFDA